VTKLGSEGGNKKKNSCLIYSYIFQDHSDGLTIGYDLYMAVIWGSYWVDIEEICRSPAGDMDVI